MATDTVTICLQNLPLELLYLIAEGLPFKDLLKLSCVSRKMRNVAIPRLFRNYTVMFSEEGFNKLRGFCESTLCENVLSLKYIVSDFIEPGTMLDVMHYLLSTSLIMLQRSLTMIITRMKCLLRMNTFHTKKMRKPKDLRPHHI